MWYKKLQENLNIGEEKKKKKKKKEGESQKAMKKGSKIDTKNNACSTNQIKLLDLLRYH